MASILIVSNMQPSMLERGRILLEAGYRVMVASTRMQVMQRLQDGVLDLVILGESIPVAERRYITETVRRFDGRTRILLLSRKRDAQCVYSDAVSNLRCAAEDFLQVVMLLLASKQRLRRQRGFALPSYLTAKAG
jgi:PleD family two-component response regulator